MRKFFASWLLGMGICTHPVGVQIRRRGPHGRMGFECMDCHRWWPVNLGRSPLARRLDRRQLRERARRTVPPQGAASPLEFPNSNRKDGTYS